MPRIKDLAIVLRETDWSETSQIVTLLTQAHGLVRGLAKGAKRQAPSSVQRYSGGLEPLTLGQVVGTLKPATGLATLTEWDLLDPYPHFHRDLQALHLGLYVADVTAAFLADHDPHPASFAAVRTALSGLASAAERAGVLLRFQWSFLQDAGLAPRLDADVRGGAALPEAATYLFDARAGGLMADDGRPEAGWSPTGPWRVRHQTIDLLRQLADGRDWAGTAAGIAGVQRANRLLCAYMRSTLDRELPTMRFVLEG